MPYRFILIPIALVGLCASSSIASGQRTISSKNPQVIQQMKPLTPLPKFLKTLKNAAGIDGPHVGVAATPGSNHLAFQEAKSKGAELYSLLLQHYSQATPAGQLYFASLIREIDSVEGTKLLKALESDDSQISHLSGCLMLSGKVSDFAAKLLDPEKYLEL